MVSDQKCLAAIIADGHATRRDGARRDVGDDYVAREIDELHELLGRISVGDELRAWVCLLVVGLSGTATATG